MDVSALSNAARAALKRAKTRHNTVELAQPGDYK
jgi:hypothetical protein